MSLTEENKTNLLEIVKCIKEAIEDKKGKNIFIVDVKGLTTLCDYAIVAEGGVDRHVKAIAQNIEKKLDEMNYPPYKVEGQNTGQWVVLDYLDIMVHVFTPELRERYQLENLYKDGTIVEGL